MSTWNKPQYVVCIAKPIKAAKRQFTEVGVAWVSENGSIKVAIDITVILGPTDELFLFLKDKGATRTKNEIVAPEGAKGE
jgi:hypothetical protein